MALFAGKYSMSSYVQVHSCDEFSSHTAWPKMRPMHILAWNLSNTLTKSNSFWYT